MTKIRRLIFNMKIPILWKDGFYIETVTRDPFKYYMHRNGTCVSVRFCSARTRKISKEKFWNLTSVCQISKRWCKHFKTYSPGLKMWDLMIRRVVRFIKGICVTIGWHTDTFCLLTLCDKHLSSPFSSTSPYSQGTAITQGDSLYCGLGDTLEPQFALDQIMHPGINVTSGWRSLHSDITVIAWQDTMFLVTLLVRRIIARSNAIRYNTILCPVLRRWQ